MFKTFFKNMQKIFSRKAKLVDWKNDDEDKLILHLEYKHQGNYTSSMRSVKSTITRLLSNFKEGAAKDDYIFIESKFNGINYPFFDLDNEEMKDTFLEIYKEEKFVLFQSSPEHYWAILDENVDLKFLFQDTKWLTCNDPKYVSCSKSSENLRIRGLYAYRNRKPQIIQKNRENEFTENFSKYIESMVEYYNNDGLELSVLKYKTPELILLFDRKKKLTQLTQSL